MHKSVIQAITDLLFIKDQPSRSDLIFALGSREDQVIHQAVALYHQGFAPYILISGGIHEDRCYTTKEAEVFHQIALDQGVPPEAILIETEASNTKENFTFTKSLAEERIGFQNIQSVILVGKSFHGRRSIMTAKQWWPKHINYRFIPVTDKRNIQLDNWWHTEEAKIRVLDEVRRIGEYAAKGDLFLDYQN